MRPYAHLMIHQHVIAVALRGLVVRPGKCISLHWVQSDCTEVSTLLTCIECRQRHCIPNEVEESQNGEPKQGHENSGRRKLLVNTMTNSPKRILPALVGVGIPLH
jgi:hypothetical protein